MYDYYEPKLADEPINVALNEAIERAAAGKAELPHPYLGASIVGSDCLRRVQYPPPGAGPGRRGRVRDP